MCLTKLTSTPQVVLCSYALVGPFVEYFEDLRRDKYLFRLDTAPEYSTASLTLAYATSSLSKPPFASRG
jgi:hypothetical protein